MGDAGHDFLDDDLDEDDRRDLELESAIEECGSGGDNDGCDPAEELLIDDEIKIPPQHGPKHFESHSKYIERETKR